MNKHLHRLVFSRTRNTLVAVQETASSVSNGGRGEAAGKPPARQRDDARGAAVGGLRAISWAAICAFGLGALSPVAHAQSASTLPLVASPSAPAGQRPVIDAAQNGVPVAHIAAPTAGGVSRNQYQQFNVDKNGLILNNSAGNVQSQLGGWIAGNPQLGYVPARVIVNEVVGTDNSLLKGTIEVAGRKADVIIANPNGLFCDGCNFLNADRATLTTGTPRYDTRGGVAGFDVRQGQLTIGSSGLNASNLEQLDLIARGLVFEGEVWAQNLHVLAGANQVLYATLGMLPEAIAQAGTGATPQFAIDLKDLGGMYANQVYLIATEKGLGVNSTGRIAALQGNLQLTSNGDLTLKDAYARQDLALTALGNVSLADQVQSLGASSIASGGALTNSGVIDSTGMLAVRADSVANSGSVIGRATGVDAVVMEVNSRAANTGSISSAGDLSLRSLSLSDTGGGLQSAGNLDLSAQSISLVGTKVDTGAALSVTATGGDLLLQGAQISAAGSVALAASGGLAQTQSSLQSQQGITLHAASIANIDSLVLASGALRAEAAGVLDNTGGKLLGSAAVNLTAGSLVNDASATNQALIASDSATSVTTSSTAGLSNRGGVISGKSGLSVQTNGGNLANVNGVLVADATFDVRAGSIDSTGGQMVSRGLNGAALSIQAASLGNAGGSVNAGGALSIAVNGAIANTQGGSIQAATLGTGDLNVSSASLVNDGGVMNSGGGVSVSTGRFSNEGGVIASSTTTSITADATSNRQGSIASVAGTRLSTQAFDNTGGKLGSAAALSIDTHGQTFVNTGGEVGATGPVTLSAGAIMNTQGSVASARDQLGVAASSLDNTSGVISAATAASVRVSDLLTNANGVIVADSAIVVSAGVADNTAGRIVANDGPVSIAAGRVVNDAGLVSSSTSTSIASVQALSNPHGRIVANDAVNIATAALDNTAGLVSASRTALDLGTGTLDNTDGRLLGSSQLALVNGALVNTRGVVATGAALTLDTQGAALSNAGGTLSSGGAMAVRSAALDNTGGVLTSQTALSVNTGGKVTNAGGEMSASKQNGVASSTGDVVINTNGNGLDTTGGRIVAEGDLSVQSGALVSGGSAGTIAAAHDATVLASSMSNGGRVQAGNDLRLTTAGVLANTGTIAAGQDAVVSAGSISNAGTAASAAVVSAGRDLNVTTAALSNVLAAFKSGRDLSVDADTANNIGGQLAAGGALKVSGAQGASTALDNSGGQIAASGALAVSTSRLVNDAGRIESASTTSIDAGTTRNRAGVITSTAGTSLATRALDNTAGELSSAAALSVDTRGDALTNRGGKIVATQGIDLAAGLLDNGGAGVITSSLANVSLQAASLVNDSGVMSARGAVSATVAGDASNRGGSVVADQTVLLNAISVDNTGGQLIANSGTVGINAGRVDNTQGVVSGATVVSVTSTSAAVTNAGGRIVSDGVATLQGAGLNNAGGTVAATNLRVDAGSQSLDNTGGQLIGTSMVLTHGMLVNHQGLIASGTALHLDTQGQALDNTAGVIQSVDELTVRSGALDNSGGTINSKSLLDVVTTGALRNIGGELGANKRVAGASGSTATTGNVSIDTNGQALDSTSGRIVAEGDLALKAGALTSTAAGGLIAANHDASIAVASLSNAGIVQTGNDLLLAATGALTNTGAMAAGRDMRVAASAISSSGAAAQPAIVAAGRDLAVEATSLANTLAILQSGRDLSVSADSLSNVNGSVSAVGTLRVQGLASSGAAIDNAGGSILSNGAATLAATTFGNDGGQIASSATLHIESGATSNRQGVITSGTGMTLLAQAIDNTRGEISSGKSLTIDSHGQRLLNEGGVIVSTQALSIGAGALENRAAGVIGSSTDSVALDVTGLVNDGGILSAKLNIVAQVADTASNLRGQVVAGQTLDLKAGRVDNTAGQLISNLGAITLTAGQMSNALGAVSAAQGLAVNATGGQLDNAGGQLVSDGSITLKAAGIGNAGGVVSGKDVAVDAGANVIDNTGGTLIGSASLALASAGLVNRQGLVATSGALVLDTQGAAFDNSGGQAMAGGKLTARSAALNNAGGTLTSATAVSIDSAALDNTAGRIIATPSIAASDTGVLSIDTHGATLDNTRGLISALNQLNVTAGAVNNTMGQIGASASDAHAKLVVASLTNADGLVSAGTVDLTSTGSVTNAGGSIGARQDLTVAAQSVANLVSGSVAGQSGQLVAGRDLSVATTGALANNVALIQSGRSQNVQVDTLNNDGGVLDSHGKLDVTVRGAASNRGGAIQTANATGANVTGAGTLSLASASLDNTAGRVNAATALTLTTGQLINADGGVLQSSGGMLKLTATQADNRHGTIVSAEDLLASTSAFDNTGGAVSAQRDLNLDTHGAAFTNQADGTRDAVLQAGRGLALTTGAMVNANGASTNARVVAQTVGIDASSISNAGTMAAVGTAGADGSFTATVSGAFVNDGGVVQAQGRLTSSSRTLSNRGGKIVAASATGASTPGLSISTQGALVNADGGLIAALDGGAHVGTQGATLDNSRAGVLYAKGALDVTAGVVDNTQGGAVQSGAALVATTLALNNTGGVIQGGSVTLDTQGRQLTNDQGNILSTGAVTLASGGLSNNAGTIASAARLGIAASGAVDNSAGLMSGTQGLTLTATGQSVTNAGGTIRSAQGDVSVSADAVNNDAGLIASAGVTNVSASTSISNRAKAAAQSASNGSASGQGQIVGQDVVIATATLDNSGGRIAADHDATVTTTRTDNTGGEISAKNNATLIAPTLVNTNGQILADGAASITTLSTGFGGTLSGADLVLAVQGDYTNTGTLTAARKLSLSANNITNSGEISAVTTDVSAVGTLTNTGLIDGTTTTVTAQTLNNSGRIYGDTLAVGGGAITNASTGAIAARDSLAIGAQSLTNTGGGLVYAANDIIIGGALSAGAVQGSMQTLLNAGSTIEAGRDLSASVNALTNRNDGLTLGSTTTTIALNTTLIQPEGGTIKYSLSQLGWDPVYNGIGHWVIDSATYPISVYGLTKRLPSQTTTCGFTGGSAGNGDWVCTTVDNYPASDPIWALFKVAPPDYSGLSVPTMPAGTNCMKPWGGDSGFEEKDTSGACGVYWTALDTYSATLAQRAATANNALDAKIDAFNADVSVRMFDKWNEYQTTSRTTTTPTVESSNPAQLLAGRNLTIVASGAAAGALLNDNSAIVAGGTLIVVGSTVTNQGTTGVQMVTDSGQVRFRDTKYGGNWDSDYSVEYTAWTPIVPAPVTTTITLASYTYKDHAADPTSSQTLTGGTPGSLKAGGAGTVGSTLIKDATAPTATRQAAASFAAANAEASKVAAAGDVSSGAIAEAVPSKALNVDAKAAAASAIDAANGTKSIGIVSAAQRAEASAAVPVNASISVKDFSTPASIESAQAPGMVSVTKQQASAAESAASVATSAPAVDHHATTTSDQSARSVILTAAPSLRLPTSSLFKINAAPGASVLVETDPRFTNQQTFLSSDYFQQQLQLDPARSLKRYGDGFEEQQLVNDQILALTGRRYLSGYDNTQTEYQALMDAGVVFAKTYQLSPGVALNAEQMALLTTDIVWLTTRTVTLPDGSTQQVLVPQVYLRQPQAGDLSPTGALMSASNVYIKSTGDLVNSGTMQGDIVTLLSDADIVNQGSVRGADIYARASNDLKNIGGTISGDANSAIGLSAGRDIVLQTTTQASSTLDGSSTRTNVDRIATVQGGTVSFDAARDIVAQGAALQANVDLTARAGRDIDVGAVQATLSTNTATGGSAVDGAGVTRTGHVNEVTLTNQVTTITAGNNAALLATGNVSLIGGDLSAVNNVIVRGANVTIQAVKDFQSADVLNVGDKKFNGATSTNEALAGGAVVAGNNLAIIAAGQKGADGNPVAGTGNLTTAGAALAAGLVSGSQGQATLIANNNVTIGALTTAKSTSFENFDQTSSGIAHVYSHNTQQARQESTQSTKVNGSSIEANSLQIQAGSKATQSGDINLSGSGITVQGAASLSAGRDVIVDAAQQSSSSTSHSENSSSFSVGPKVLEKVVQTVTKSLLQLDPVSNKFVPVPSFSGNSTEKDSGATTATQSVGSSISADSLTIDAGRDATVRGSVLVTTQDLSIAAARNLSIVTSQDQQTSNQSRNEANNGLFNSGGSLTTGTRTLDQAGNGTASTATGSQVASLSGSVMLKAGEAYQQTGSQVLALAQGADGKPGTGLGGDISIAGKTVQIDAARNTSTEQQSNNFKQEGVTVSVSSPIISALQGLAQTAEVAGKTKDDRMKALAAATAVMQAASVAEAIADPTVGISIDLGHSQSQSKSSQSSDVAVGSKVSAARDLTITATGSGKDSNITVTGSDLTAGRNATVKADGAITLQAATSTDTLDSTNSSQSASIGVTYGGGASNGLSIHAAASAGRGYANGTDITNTNSHLSAGNVVSIQSGGDTTLKGGVVQGNQVQADIGGNLNVQSLQDATKYDAKQQSAGISVTLCIPPICYGQSSVSGSVSNAKANGDFLSVAEQSGIKTGDAGFQINVKGNTDLKGGVIVSTQAAIDAGKNSLSTATLTQSDIANRDDYKAGGIALSGSYSSAANSDQQQELMKDKPAATEDDRKALTPQQRAAYNALKNDGTNSKAVGFSSDGGSQSSVTVSGVSAGNITITDSPAQKALTGTDAATALAGLNTKVTTDSNTSGAIKKNWDGQQLLEQTQANVQITQNVLPKLANAIGTVMGNKANELLAQAYKAPEGSRERQDLLDEAAKYGEGGAYRIAAHALLGALAGGVGGAVGAGVSQATVPAIGDAIRSTGLPTGVQNLLIDVAGTVVGAVAGGAVGGNAGAASGGYTGFNATDNNYLKHDEALRLQKALAACKAGDNTACTTSQQLIALSQQRDAQLTAACQDIASTACKTALAGLAAAQASYAGTSDIKGGSKAAQIAIETNTWRPVSAVDYSPGDVVHGCGGATNICVVTNVPDGQGGYLTRPATSSEVADEQAAMRDFGRKKATEGAIGYGLDILGGAFGLRGSGRSGATNAALADEVSAEVNASKGGTNRGTSGGAGTASGGEVPVDDSVVVGGTSSNVAASKPVNVTTTQLLPSAGPGNVVPNAMSPSEIAQATDIVSNRGGTFVGQTTSNTPGIDGLLDGVPVSLKTVTGNGMTALQRNIVNGAKQMVNAGTGGDMYVDATATGVTTQNVTAWVQPGSPISNILNEGTVRNIVIKTSNGWITLTRSTLTRPGG